MSGFSPKGIRFRILFSINLQKHGYKSYSLQQDSNVCVHLYCEHSLVLFLLNLEVKFPSQKCFFSIWCNFSLYDRSLLLISPLHWLLLLKYIKLAMSSKHSKSSAQWVLCMDTVLHSEINFCFLCKISIFSLFPNNLLISIYICIDVYCNIAMFCLSVFHENSHWWHF